MDNLNILLSVFNAICVLVNILITAKHSKRANDISEKQLKEAQKPDVARNIQLSSISRSIQHLDSTLMSFLSDKDI
nr:MAG TPA: hypothetical protein [Caudoviricetes sp.]